MVFRIAHESALPAAFGRRFGVRMLPFHGGSALVHAGLLAAIALFTAAAPSSDDGVTDEQRAAIARSLRASAEKDLDEAAFEEVAAQLHDKDGSHGTRAKGEEASMGSPRGDRYDSRYGVQGPSDPDPHVARGATLRDANEFGMVGLLQSGAGGDPNAPTAPWGYDNSLGVSAGGGRGNGLGLSSIGGVGHGGAANSGFGHASGPRHGAGAGVTTGAGAPTTAPGSGLLNAGPRGGNPAAPSVPTPSAAIDSMSAPAAPEIKINPNGRFATTYRPGRGHLAAFDAAVARGAVPEAERQLVGDLGGGYTPAFQVPDGDALALRTDLERAKLPPRGGPFHVRLALRSSAEAPKSRAHLSVHLVLDLSGSMSGDAIAQARDAARALVDRLAPTDDFSLVTFSTEAAVRVPDGLVGPRREAIKKIISELRAEGGTNIGEGLSLGYAQAASRTIPEDAVRVVLLLSDGRATAGDTRSEYLSNLALDAFQRGVQTSSFGLGSDYDGALMSSIAADGAGGYYYLRDPSHIASALATELDQRLDPVATAVEVRVRLKPDVDLLRAYGSRRLSEGESSRVRAVEVAADAHAAKRDGIRRDRHEDRQEGMRFFIPAFSRGDDHALLIKLALPEGVGARDVALVELKYKDRLRKKNVVREIPLRVEYANGDAASAATADRSMARTIQGFAAGDALAEAAARIAQGDRQAAVNLLSEREGILRQAADTLDEPRFLEDAGRLTRLRAHAGSTTGMGEPLVLAMLLETASRSHLH
jgi:Mg-chelatase subunit ChlD